MNDRSTKEPGRDPQELPRLLVARERAGDAAGMASLYQPDAVLDCGGGRLARGREAIRQFYAGLIAKGVVFEIAEQRAPIVNGDLALTSTRLPNGGGLPRSRAVRAMGRGPGVRRPPR